ncbi:hypothetical protein GGI21_000767 [Coemansia aciculifera]|nr:hypothetical protein GGI21_000767 [Coemansia aciculifera]
MNPAFLEIREFVVNHVHKETASTQDSTPVSPTSPLRTPRAAPSIPTASLRNIANSFLEESRFEEGVRFLTTVGSSSLILDAKIITNLLAIFKSTNLIEKNLEKRSQYLLQNMGIANVDYSQVWKVDNQRRRSISQSQQRVLAYLDSVNVQFVRHWFDDVYASRPGDFWDYFDELTMLPNKAHGAVTEEQELELELYQNRMSLACILLEQMCADLASNMAALRRSVFLKIVFQGTVLTRLSYPAMLKDVICKYFARISFQRCPLEESKVLELVLDMTTLAVNCNLLVRDNCAQMLARCMYENDDAHLFIRFVDLLSSDTMAMSMIDYAFVSWFRFAALPGGRWTAVEKNYVGMPPSAAKTAFCLRHVRPQAKAEDPDQWYAVVCMLAKLVQRSVSAYGQRMCRVNGISQLDAADLGSDYPHMLLVASGCSDMADMASSCQLLKAYLESKLPRPSAEEVANDANDAMDCSNSSDSDTTSESGLSRVALLSMIYMELDRIETLLSCCH